MLPSNPGVEFIILCQCVIVSLAVKVFITSLVGLCFSVSGTEMFVSFAVLSDIGYGDMLDTLLTTHSIQASNIVFSVRSETLQDRTSLDSIILTIPATDGITVNSAQDGVN